MIAVQPPKVNDKVKVITGVNKDNIGFVTHTTIVLKGLLCYVLEQDEQNPVPYYAHELEIIE